MHAPLTDTETAALQAFAKEHGRRWKSALSDKYWYNARLWSGADGNDKMIGSALHGLRNSHGPSWLSTYKLPQA